MRRRAKSKVDVDVVPYLSIMVIVLKLISLILIVVVVPIALNPHMIKSLSFKGLFQGSHNEQEVLSPTYLDCRRDRVIIQPDNVEVTAAELTEPENPVTRMLARVTTESTNEYVIMIIRPQSLPVYRQLRKLERKFSVRIAYDMLDENTAINWRKEAQELNMTLPN